MESNSLSNQASEKKDILGPSFLDIVQQKNLSSLRATFYSRSSFCARLCDDIQGNDSAKIIQDFCAKALKKLNCDASGFMLIQDSTICAFLESSSEQFTEFCVELQKFTGIESTRIIATCDDNPTRLMQSLFFKRVTLGKSSDGELTDDNVEQTLFDIVSNLVAFAKRLGAMQPVSKYF